MSEVAPFLTILTIATRNYARYAIDLIKSIDQFVEQPTQILCFTDDEKKFDSLRVANHELVLVNIPSYGWPNATLLRYHIFDEHHEKFNGDVVIYMDADTIFVDKCYLSSEMINSWANGIALVQHPGYFRAPLKIKLYEKLGSGTWETRRSSVAAVPLIRRRKYVCGGVWMGRTPEIIKMIAMLKMLVDADKRIGIRAIHNDESYLNSWSSIRKVARLTPEWAFADGYKNLIGIKPIIKVVHKPENWVREADDPVAQ